MAFGRCQRLVKLASWIALVLLTQSGGLVVHTGAVAANILPSDLSNDYWAWCTTEVFQGHGVGAVSLHLSVTRVELAHIVLYNFTVKNYIIAAAGLGSDPLVGFHFHAGVCDIDFPEVLFQSSAVDILALNTVGLVSQTQPMGVKVFRNAGVDRVGPPCFHLHKRPDTTTAPLQCTLAVMKRQYSKQAIGTGSAKTRTRAHASSAGAEAWQSAAVGSVAAEPTVAVSLTVNFDVRNMTAQLSFSIAGDPALLDPRTMTVVVHNAPLGQSGPILLDLTPGLTGAALKGGLVEGSVAFTDILTALEMCNRPEDYYVNLTFSTPGASSVRVQMPAGRDRISRSQKVRALRKTLGVTIAGVLLVGAAAGLFVQWQRRKGEGSAIERSSSTFSHREWWREFSYAELEEATNSFSQERVLGQGGFGAVYLGYLPLLADEQLTPLAAVEEGCGGVEAVAVKKLVLLSEEGEAGFIAEANLLAKMRHRNLVQLRGGSTEGGSWFLVYEYMKGGGLDRAIFPPKNARLPPPPVMPWTHRARVLLGVAQALNYVHLEWDEQVIHRDVKPSNILLDASPLDPAVNAKLGDFGLARATRHECQTLETGPAFTPGFAAPEALLTKSVTAKLDVYSFGMTMMEVVSGRRSFYKEGGTAHSLALLIQKLYREGSLLEAADPVLEGRFSAEELIRFLKVALLCTAWEPQQRPPMYQVIELMRGSVEVCESQLRLVSRDTPAANNYFSNMLFSENIVEVSARGRIGSIESCNASIPSIFTKVFGR